MRGCVRVRVCLARPCAETGAMAPSLLGVTVQDERAAPSCLRQRRLIIFGSAPSSWRSGVSCRCTLPLRPASRTLRQSTWNGRAGAVVFGVPLCSCGVHSARPGAPRRGDIQFEASCNRGLAPHLLAPCPSSTSTHVPLSAFRGAPAPVCSDRHAEVGGSESVWLFYTPPTREGTAPGR